MTAAKKGKQQILNRITAGVSRVVIGKDDIKELLLVALLSRGHVLVEGLPGTAKTTLARTFARVIGGKFQRVQGTPDMLPADILGFRFYHSDGSPVFMPGPIFANVVLADELNRTAPRTQAALLEAMQEGQVTIERETYPLEQPFVVIASQIPYGGVGTSPLSDVQIDRFMFRVWSGSPTVQEEDRILEDIDRISEAEVSPVTSLADILQLQQEVEKVHIADSIRRYIVSILDSLRRQPDLLAGPSPRGGIALFKGSRALAFIQGRDFVIPDDVRRLLMPALCHRLKIGAEAEMDNVTPEAIINKVAGEVPVPKEGVAGPVGEISKGTRETVEIPVAAPGEAVVSVAEETDDEVAGGESKAGEEALAEVRLLSARVEETLGKAREALAKAEGPTLSKFNRWEWVLIACAVVVAVVMICVGLVSIS